MLVGDRQIPWWAVLLSVLGSEISALTFMGVPAFAYTGNWTYLQVTLGAIVGRFLVARFFVPAFYDTQVVSIYEFILLRFGPWSRNAAVVVFLFTRVLMSGVRLYAGALVLQAAFGWSASQAVVVLALVGLVFCALGGIKAVVWTEVVQVSIMFLGALCALLVLLTSVSPGWWHQLPAGSLQVVDTRFDWSTEFTLWSVLLGSSLMNAAVFGTDYDMVQRMLTARDARQSRRAVLGSALAEIPIFTMFLLIGTLLRVFYAQHPDPGLPAEAKQIFGHFIVTQLPLGLRGLLVAAVISVVLSTYESALTALAGSFIVDLYRPYLRPDEPAPHYVAATRWATLVFALLLVVVAIASRDVKNILTFGLEVGTYSYGALLALFVAALALRNRAGMDRWNALVAVPASIVFVLVLKTHTDLAFPWFVASGAVVGLLCVGLGRAWLPKPT